MELNMRNSARKEQICKSWLHFLKFSAKEYAIDCAKIMSGLDVKKVREIYRNMYC